MDKDCSVWIGFDHREAAAYAVCRDSIERNETQKIPIRGVILADLQEKGLYTRAVEHRDNQLFDPISGAHMSTEFAISRFFVPRLAKKGWALFMDCDMLVTVSLSRLFEQLDPRYAVYCVKHDHQPQDMIKMDGQVQTRYQRKNWSSFMVFNCDHDANQRLNLRMLNGKPGRELHNFCWLYDNEIGELGQEWNYLVGYSPDHIKPKVIHYTSGGPWMKGFEDVEYAGEWTEALRKWAR
jgi:lipopolysaccharide biosynthesis glycosyltransferase